MWTSSIPRELIPRASVWLDPGITPCVKTHTSAKCRKHNSPARHRTSRVQYDLTPRDAIARRYFYVWRDRWSFRTAKTQLGLERVAFAAMHGPHLLLYLPPDVWPWGIADEAARIHHVARRRTHKLANSGKCATGSSRAHRGGADGACRRCGSPGPLNGFRAGSRKGGLVPRRKPSHRVTLCLWRFYAHAGSCEGAGGTKARLHSWPQHPSRDGADASYPDNSDRVRVRIRSNRQRIRCEHGTTCRQHDWVHDPSGHHYRQIPIDAERNGAAARPRSHPLQSGFRASRGHILFVSIPWRRQGIQGPADHSSSAQPRRD